MEVQILYSPFPLIIFDFKFFIDFSSVDLYVPQNKVNALFFLY